MPTKTTDAGVPSDYDPSQYPAFAVTVDVVVLTMSEGMLHVLLVCRGEPPFEGAWAIPGGFKRPAETLDEAAQRELREETGVDGASLLAQVSILPPGKGATAGYPNDSQWTFPQFHARPSEPVTLPIVPAAGAMAGKLESLAAKSRSKSPPPIQLLWTR